MVSFSRFFCLTILLLNEYIECRVFSKKENKILSGKHIKMAYEHHDRPSAKTDTSKGGFLKFQSLKEETKQVFPRMNSDDINVQHRAEKYDGLPEQHDYLGLRRSPTVDIKWPSGQIPYLVDNNSYDALLEYRLKNAMRTLESISCITFKRLEYQPITHINWIHITNPEKKRGCTHETGQPHNGEIRVIFGLDCLKSVEILHTLLHGIGLHDEVSHPRRDRHVRILWENIRPEYRNLFYKKNIYTSSSVEFDPLSVMSFHDHAFSRNGQPTIVPIGPNVIVAPSLTLSELDKKKIQIKFGLECKKLKAYHITEMCAKLEIIQLNKPLWYHATTDSLPKINDIMSDCDSDYDSRSCFRY